jgi:hypothetical protein
MICVEQRHLWRPDDHLDGPQRGDCAAACVASIFELPYEECAEIGATDDTITAWTEKRYPGISYSHRMLGEGWRGKERIEDYVNWPTSHYERGYWMATIWSPRIPDVETFDCGCAYDQNNESTDPDPNCKWCHGDPGSRSMGITWGLHAVVMLGANLAWDPHPAREKNPTLYFCGASKWTVTDPSQLISKAKLANAVANAIELDQLRRLHEERTALKQELRKTKDELAQLTESGK